jgi:MFS family permease
MSTNHKNFRLMVIGQVISVLGSALLRFALSLYVLDVTGRADIFATLFAVSNIPMLLSPIGGAIADRFNRRNLMVIFDFTSSAIVLFLFLMVRGGGKTVPLIAVVMVLLSIIAVMYAPTVMASIPQLVAKEKIEGANGIVQAVQSLSNVAAPLLGGVLYGILGVHALIVISGIAFFLSAVMELFIQIPFEKRESNGNAVYTIYADMKEGFLFVKKKAFIWQATLLAALLNLILTPFFMVGTPILLRMAMKSNDVMYGIGMSTFYTASIIGALSIGYVSKKMKIEKIYQGMILLSVLMFVVAVFLSPILMNGSRMLSYVGFVVTIFPIAMIMTIQSIFIVAKVQLATPNKNLGKVMAIIMAIANCVAPIGQVIYGIAFKQFEARFHIPTIAVGIAILGIAVLCKFMSLNMDTMTKEQEDGAK